MQDLMLEDRTLTELDHMRIQELIKRDTRDEQWPSRLGNPIEALLDSAELVPSRRIPRDVVTMHSQVLVVDAESGRHYTLMLCYPSDAKPDKGFISVLSPVGMSLLGLRTGCVARWHTPSGERRELEVVAILFQPEATGDYTL